MSGKKLSTVLALLIVTSLLATACATPTPQVVKETVVVTKEVPVEVTKVVEKVVTKEVEKPRVEVRLSGWTASPEEENLLRASLYEFSLKNPDIIVKYEPITADYWPKIKTMVASGTEPDIY